MRSVQWIYTTVVYNNGCCNHAVHNCRPLHTACLSFLHFKIQVCSWMTKIAEQVTSDAELNKNSNFRESSNYYSYGRWLSLSCANCVQCFHQFHFPNHSCVKFLQSKLSNYICSQRHVFEIPFVLLCMSVKLFNSNIWMIMIKNSIINFFHLNFSSEFNFWLTFF